MEKKATAKKSAVTVKVTTGAAASASTTTTRKRTTRKKKENECIWNIVSALNNVLQNAHNSELSDLFWDMTEEPLQYLTETLSLTKKQVIVLAMLVDSGRALSYRHMAAYLKVSRLQLLAYATEIDELVEKRWIRRAKIENESDGFALVNGVVEALSKNKVFVPARIDNLTEEQFYNKIDGHLQNTINNYNAVVGDDIISVKAIMDANPQLEIMQMMEGMTDDEKFMFMLIIDDYIQWNNTPHEGITEDCIDKFFLDDELGDPFATLDLDNGDHILIKKGWVEQTCTVDGIAETERYSLTTEIKNRLFAGKSKILRKRYRSRKSNAGLTLARDIKEKALFYNADEARQIERLESLLTKDQLPKMQQRLEEMNMRKGFAVLFYGAPGCGKTETVMQIARKTGRDIMFVDIAGMRDKYVGESEKNIKQVFMQYREICHDRAKNIPILLFNEADALIGKRTNNAETSVDKMNNAMMNILLQELETFEGILIATTNLTANMDSAFERRFLFKTEFHRPDVDVKAKIWSSMIDGLTDSDAHTLASRYDFSGGEIENVARKHIIEYILSGEKTSLDNLDRFCQEEKLSSNVKAIPVAGFRV